MKQIYILCALLSGFAIGSRLGQKGNQALKENYAIFLKQIHQAESMNQQTEASTNLMAPNLDEANLIPSEDPNLTQHN